MYHPSKPEVFYSVILQHGAATGEVQLEVRERLCPKGQWAWNSPKLPKFKKHQYPQTLGLVLCGPVWSQDLISVILVSPSQLRVSYDSKSFSSSHQ